LPERLLDLPAHLDPDFEFLTYGGVDGLDLSSDKVHQREGPLRALEECDLRPAERKAVGGRGQT
jgi:hypothetical protein